MIRCTALALVACLAFLANADEPPAKKDEKKADAKVVQAPKMGVMQLPVPKGESQAAKDYAKIMKVTNKELKKATTQAE